jgi:prepilin-type N-terminal cleavage/methylation domain-containing protein
MTSKIRLKKAFTLIEMLVVVAIVSILFSISFAAFSGAGRSAKISATKTLIETLKTAIENYSNDFGDYPPSSGKRAGLTSNGLNDGVESLVRCLSTTRKNGPYFEFSDKQLYNADEDQTAKDGPRSSFGVNTLYEVIDDWGHPLVYLHNKDYAKGQKVTELDDNMAAKKVDATGAKSGKTGQYQSLTSFQIWSCGPDGKNDGGEGDDVTSWK